MRPDGRDAETLTGLGYTPDVDFVAVQDGPKVRIDWLSAQPMPSEAEINAFDMSPEAVEDRENAKEPLLAELKAQADGAIESINSYLLVADNATQAQVRAEVKAAAQQRKVMIRALKRLAERVWR